MSSIAVLSKEFYKRKIRRYRYLGSLMISRPKFDFDNVFVIGYNKTGTTSVNLFLRSLGLRHLTINKHVKSQWKKGNYDYLIFLTKRFNSFDDLPWNRTDVVERLVSLDQDSRFILTVREPNAWFDSWVRFEHSIGRTPPRESQRDEYIQVLLQHDEDCRRLVGERNHKFLELELAVEPEPGRKIADFLGLGREFLPEFPHANRTR